jgi:hypothetical protein
MQQDLSGSSHLAAFAAPEGKRVPIPQPTIELTTVLLGRATAPLLAEERDVGGQTLVSDVAHPLRLHLAMARP